MVTAPKFLESLANIPTLDYMLSKKESNPVIFLKRIRWLIKKIPQLNNFLLNTKFVQITGTSGKGTTGAILQEILNSQGTNKVGFYNSPHTQTVYQRIRIADKNQKTNQISAQDFNALVCYLKPFLEKTILESPYGLPSYFEIIFTLALLYFKKQKCNYVILEAGCGGRYDATNVIPKNCLSIITNIGYDHERLLGPKLTDIAWEKAGIIKKNSLVLIGANWPKKIIKIIRQEADQKKARLIIANKTSVIDQNCALAAKAGQLFSINQNKIKKAIKNYTPLPGRLEIIKKNPLIIFDGAHNPDKIKYLINKIKPELKQKNNTKTLIFAACDSKKWPIMLKLLIPFFDKIYLTRHNVWQRKTADLKKMFNLAKKINPNKKIKIFIDPINTFKKAQKNQKKNNFILATGSLYLIGNLKQKNETNYC